MINFSRIFHFISEQSAIILQENNSWEAVTKNTNESVQLLSNEAYVTTPENINESIQLRKNSSISFRFIESEISPIFGNGSNIFLGIFTELGIAVVPGSAPEIIIIEKEIITGIMGIDAVSDIGMICIKFNDSFPQQEVVVYDPYETQIVGTKNNITAKWWLNLNTLMVSASFATLPELNISPPPPTATWQEILDYQFELLNQPRIDFEIKFKLKGDTSGRYESEPVRLSGFNSIYGKVNYNLMPYLTEIAALGISKNHQMIFSIRDAGYGLLKTYEGKKDELSIFGSGLFESNWATTSDDRLIQII